MYTIDVNAFTQVSLIFITAKGTIYIHVRYSNMKSTMIPTDAGTTENSTFS